MRKFRTASTSKIIVDVLRVQGRMRKGTLEDSIRQLTGTYGDTTARRARELACEGTIVKHTDDEGVTWYALATSEPEAASA